MNVEGGKLYLLVEAFEHVVCKLSRTDSVNLGDIFSIKVVRIQTSVHLTGVTKENHKLCDVRVVNHLRQQKQR